MARLRYNGLKSALGAALSSSATSITFNGPLTHANGVAVPTIVAPDYIPLTLLDGTGNFSEIVYLTAYTTGATSGTITRAAEGAAVAVAHASGDKIVHAMTILDVQSGRMLGLVEVSASTSWATSVNTDADVDAANLAVTFLAPASGRVLVELECIYILSGGAYLCWSVREGTTMLNQVSLGQVAYDRGRVSMLITGLVPGSAHTYKWGFSRLGTTGTATMYAGGNGGTIGNPMMRVTAA